MRYKPRSTCCSCVTIACVINCQNSEPGHKSVGGSMSQLEFFDIPSPCIGVCESNNRGYCKGCLRSRDERLYWLKLSPAQKREVIRLCQQRKMRILNARKAQQLAGQTQAGDDRQGALF